MKNNLKMSLPIGLTMSFFMTLNGLLTAGKLNPMNFISSFLLSFLVSMIIGLLIPMDKVNVYLAKKFSLKKGELKTRAIEALVSDLIYTPIMTLVMIAMAYHQAVSHGAKIEFLPMFIKALLSSLLLGYILSFIISGIMAKVMIKNKTQ